MPSNTKYSFFNVRTDGGVLVIAHRGGPGLNPENTLEAFRNAQRLGADVVELDIHTSKDGHMVIMHDDDIDRTTNGSGNVRDYTLAELKGFDAGYNWTNDEGKTYPFRGKGIQIPTLEEVISEIKTNIIIEIKQEEPSLIKPLAALIRKHGIEDRIIVASFSNKALIEFRKEMPEVATSTNKSEAVRFFMLNMFHLAGFYNPSPAVALQVPEFHSGKKVITKRFVNTAKSHGLEVHAWTINEVDDMKRMIEIGVEGIVTDYPDRLLKLLGRL